MRNDGMNKRRADGCKRVMSKDQIKKYCESPNK
jgi:hypothetical protein